MKLTWGAGKEAFRPELVAFLDAYAPPEAAGGLDRIRTTATCLDADWQRERLEELIF